MTPLPLLKLPWLLPGLALLRPRWDMQACRRVLVVRDDSEGERGGKVLVQDAGETRWALRGQLTPIG